MAIERERLASRAARSRPPKTTVCASPEHRLAIELDGGVHSQIDQMRRDAVKEDYLRTLGNRLLRIPNAMVLEHPDESVREVVKAFRGSVEKLRK